MMESSSDEDSHKPIHLLMESSSDEDIYVPIHRKPGNSDTHAAEINSNMNVTCTEEGDNTSDSMESSSDEDNFIPTFTKKTDVEDNIATNIIEKSSNSKVVIIKGCSFQSQSNKDLQLSILNEKTESQDITDTNAIEENSKSNVTCTEESSISSFTTEAGGENSSCQTDKNIDAGDGNIKFLSSEFFQEFVCHPSTSKENPEVIRKIDNEKEGDESSMRSTNPESIEESEDMSGFKLRKIFEKHQEETSNSKSSNINESMRNPPFENYAQPFNFVHYDKKTYNSSDEYFSDLRLWLQQAFFWQSVTAAFPYFLMCQQFGPVTNNISNQQGPPGFNFPPQFTVPVTSFQGLNQPNNPRTNSSVQSNQIASRQVTDGVECRVPSFWKRIVAEFIDFMILFFVKIAVTYIAIEYFQIIDLEQIEIIPKDSKMAYKQLVQITQEVVVLELIHRLVVCVFETFWLRGPYNGQIGSATPGKNIMGLRVLYCDTSVFVRENEGVILVKPGTNLNLGTALFRSTAKNFIITLLVPTSFAFIFFPHNRTGYDMICNTIVVEEPLIPHRINE